MAANEREKQLATLVLEIETAKRQKREVVKSLNEGIASLETQLQDLATDVDSEQMTLAEAIDSGEFADAVEKSGREAGLDVKVTRSKR